MSALVVYEFFVTRRGAYCAMWQFFSGIKLLPVMALVTLVGVVTASLGEAIDIEGHRVFAFDGIQKSEQDKCSYRHLTLENGLQALLISEPGLDKVHHHPPPFLISLTCVGKCSIRRSCWSFL